MYYVYRFLDKAKNIIYVGKSKQDLEQRFRGHLHLPDACYDLTYRIEYIECATESDMSIKEIYYINKYRHDGEYFNVLDMADVPVSVEFNDKWKQYSGPLGPQFHHSLNFIEGYTKEKETRYNKDGAVDQRINNKQKGISSAVDAFTKDEVDQIIDYLTNSINSAKNNNQEQIRFRNLVMFILGINLPLKLNDFLRLKYKDVFTENDLPKPISFILARTYQDEIVQIPLQAVVQQVLVAYRKQYNFTYVRNSEDYLFESRKHQVLDGRSIWQILNSSITALGIIKNIGGESLRKTYGNNIYQLADNKLNALVFLEKMWGGKQYGNIITYLKLADEYTDYDYYFSATFSLGDVDLSKIECLNQKTNFAMIHPQIKQTSQVKTGSKAKPKNNSRKWSKEELEIIEKHLKQNIPIEVLAEEYNLPKSIIKFWINNYEQEFEDSINVSKQMNENNRHGLSTSENKRVEKKEPIVWYLDTSSKGPRTNKVWTKETKLEIVNKNLVQHIPQSVLAEEYDVPAGNISRWVNEYKKYGESVFEDKRHKSK